MKRNRLIKEYCMIHIAFGLAALMTGGYLFLQHEGLVPSGFCALQKATGLYCPGCGGTRAFIALMQGHFIKSLRLNPAVILGGALVLYYETGALLTIAINNGKRYYDRYGIPLYVYLAVIIIFAVVRNVMLVKYGIDWLG